MVSEEKKDTRADVRVVARCPGCGGSFQGQERGTLMVSASKTAALAHPWCTGEAKRRGWTEGAIR